MRGLVDYTDYMVICSGRTPRQSKAVVEAVRFDMKHNHGVSPRRIEGEREAEWILVDLLDCVLHVFTPDAREFYRLEHLWQDAPSESYSPPAAAAGG